jgi:ABC-2 type transport system permease protein
MTFIPLAACNYLPLHAILNRPDPLGTTRLMQTLSPLFGVAFLLVCLRIWQIGVRHYQSTGS